MAADAPSSKIEPTSPIASRRNALDLAVRDPEMLVIWTSSLPSDALVACTIAVGPLGTSKIPARVGNL